MSRPQYASLADYYNDAARHVTDKCTLCGQCLANCPMLPITDIANKDPKEVVARTIQFLKTGQSCEDVYRKVFSCASCGSCSDTCPEELDILTAFEAARMRLADQGKVPESVHHVDSVPGMWRVLSSLQSRPSEERWLRQVPSGPERTENVVFVGCTLTAFPHLVWPLLDILEAMEVDFIALAGGELCCGFPCSHAGKVAASEEMARTLVSGVKAFSPKRVILPCAGCYHHFTSLYPQILDIDFEVRYYTEFLRENLHGLHFTKTLDRTITLHESCMSRRVKMNDSVKALLDSIPGKTVVNTSHVCCGGTPKLTFPQAAEILGPVFAETLTQESRRAGSDYVVNICQLCRMTLYPSLCGRRQYPFELKDVSDIVNESIGGKHYEDKWETYSRCDTIDEIVDCTRANFEEHGFAEEDVRRVLPLFFGGAQE